MKPGFKVSQNWVTYSDCCPYPKSKIWGNVGVAHGKKSPYSGYISIYKVYNISFNYVDHLGVSENRLPWNMIVWKIIFHIGAAIYWWQILNFQANQLTITIVHGQIPIVAGFTPIVDGWIHILNWLNPHFWVKSTFFMGYITILQFKSPFLHHFS